MTQASPFNRNDSSGRWQDAILRARFLQDQYPAALDLLRFYQAVLRFQQQMACDSRQLADPAVPLRQQIDLDFVSSKFPAVLAVAAECGPQQLRRHGQTFRSAGETSWRKMLGSALLVGSPLTGPKDFFTRACLQPIADNLQRQLPTAANYSQNVCPACGGMPQMSVLRPEGEGASRWLLCSFCLRQWLFRRLVCPWCGEENKEKLPRFSADQCAHVHVEACDTCKRYLKAIDMTTDGHAVPLVDEAALAVLDFWAGDHGYTKIVPNLVGF